MNGHAGIDTLEATEHLKNILNVGKTESEPEVKIVPNNIMETTGDPGLNLNNHQSYQKIELCADMDSSHNSVYGIEVDVYSSPIDFGATCSQIIVEHMVDFGWEEKYYFGRLISIHMSGKYLAYVLKPPNKKHGFVRVLGLHSESRYLIKNYKSEVKDIAFAHSTAQVLLGSVDACGELLVHQITEDDSGIICNLLLHILRPTDWVLSNYNHVIWCLYIPDDNEDDSAEDDVSSLLVVTHNERAEIWNVNTVIKENGQGKITIDEVKGGVQVISEHKSPISTATFSPDGSALAIGSIDGVIKFFQVNTLEKDISPRCLHQWTPHGDKSLSSLYFLDNHKNHRPDLQFWKFAITGAENNTEIKVWCCETWDCLQTIKIHPNSGDCVMPSLKAEMDLSSKYLILSDIKRKVLLILIIQQDPLAKLFNKTTASIKSISEFRVPLPVLSLSVSSIGYKCPLNSGGDNSDEEEGTDQLEDDSEDGRQKLIVKLFWIQTKTLQSCRISFKPKLESPLHSIGSVSSLSQDSYGFKDGLSDISLDARDASNRSARDLDMSLQKNLCVDKIISSQSTVSNSTSLASHMNYSNCAEVLLTPDDFTSPSHTTLSTQNSFTHCEEAKSPISKCDSSVRITDGIDSLPVEPSTMQRRKSSQHSATSSPSREVAEIMAPTKSLHLDEIVLETPNINLNGNVETMGSSLSSFAISTTPATRNEPDFHMKEWPQAPDTSKEYINKNESDINNCSKCFLSSESTSSAQFDKDSHKIIYQLNERFDEMLNKIESLTELSNIQRLEIQTLQNEIKSLQDQKYNLINTNISNTLDNVISQYLVPSYSRIENLIIKSSEEDQRRMERELAVITNDFSSFSNRLDSAIKQEITNFVLPQISRILDTATQKMQMDFTQKLGATDLNIKETFSKHLKGKAFMDSLTQNISSSLQNTIQSVCRDVFQSSVIPAFEKSCHHLFHQLNELFHKGILDYIQIFEKNSMSSCSMLENTAAQIKEEINNLVTSTQQTLHNHTIQVENHNLELSKQKEIQVTNLRQIISEELRKALKDQTVLNSRTVSPVAHNDPMMQKQLLLQLVKQGNPNEAFQQALSAMDVQLVMFLCESVSVDQVFGVSPCPLQQHVLLSLVNQLSSDLSIKTETKVRYIEDVIASLDSNDPIIRDHIQSVLENLQQRIANFLQKYPTHKFSRNMKRISLAVQSLIVNN